tara:strand:+ start:7153 stop:7962 length:810 start_codon:yes stop_codon:yes gene_type:complete
MIHDGDTKLIGGTLKEFRIPTTEELPNSPSPNQLVVNNTIFKLSSRGDWSDVPVKPIPIGQAKYTAPGTYYMDVPKDVPFMSGVVIGGGGDGGSGYSAYKGAGGGGGALRWIWEFPVSEGDSLKIVVGRDGGTSSIEHNGLVIIEAHGGQRGASRGGNGGSGGGGTPLIVDLIGGGDGQDGQRTYNDGSHVSSRAGYGGGAGNYVGSNNSYGTGIGVYGRYDAGGYGRGGGGYSGSSNWVEPGSPGRSGAVRLIWGANRHYPTENVEDM